MEKADENDIILMRDYYKSSVTDPMGSTAYYTYDDRGFIASETAIESLAGYAYTMKQES